jgi:hypothetical protein
MINNIKEKISTYFEHKSIGNTVLALTLLIFALVA